MTTIDLEEKKEIILKCTECGEEYFEICLNKELKKSCPKTICNGKLLLYK